MINAKKLAYLAVLLDDIREWIEADTREEAEVSVAVDLLHEAAAILTKVLND